MRFFPALWLGKLLNVAINIIDKNRGSNFSGQWVMKADPQMIKAGGYDLYLVYTLQPEQHYSDRKSVV